MRSTILFIFILFFFVHKAIACDANCVACHPSLVKNGEMDNDHAILDRCSRCHTEKESDKDHGACGADCWSCHDIKQVSAVDIPEHRVLAKCIKCHQSIDKNFFSIPGDTGGENLLIDSLKGGM